MRKYICNGCGRERNPAQDICPYCGESGYTVSIELAESMKIHEQSRGKVKDPEFKQKKGGHVAREFKTGESYSQRDKKFYDYYQDINRKEDSYREEVTDSETGEVIHSCNESLTDHVGHGSAKMQAGVKDGNEGHDSEDSGK